MSVTVECPKCGEKATAGKQCAECGLMLDTSQVKIPAAKPDLAATTKTPPSKKPVKICLECEAKKSIIGRGLCGGCYARLKKDGTLDEKYPAKKKGRQPVETHQLSTTPVVDQKPKIIDNKPATVTPISSAVPQVTVRLSGLVLPRHERDEDLFAQLKDWADDERRSVGDQILYLLDKVVANKAKGISL